ncbi:hypothetical protein [Aegicerativicinus sediminis]
MKTRMILKISATIISLLFIGLVSHDLFGKNHTDRTENQQLRPSVNFSNSLNPQEADVIITIDKNTTDSEFEDIKEMLSENGINGSFESIERNDLGEITAIRIEMVSDNGQSSNIQLSSNMPIDTISFGRKGGQIFVEQNGASFGNLGLLSNPNFFSFGSPTDSIFRQQLQNLNGFNFDDFFKDTDKFMFQFGDSTNIGDLMKQMESQFNSINSKRFNYSLQNDPRASEYYVIIDGQESSYKNALKLEEQGQIEQMEVLSPERAKLFYGEKAKYGAIIISTK